MKIFHPLFILLLLNFAVCSAQNKEIARDNTICKKWTGGSLPVRVDDIHPFPATADTNVVLPPAWAFGIIYGAYTNQEQTVRLINQIIEHDYPIDGFWIDSWIWDWKNQGKGPHKYIDFVADTLSYPDMKGMWNFMKKKNIKAGMWIWDAVMQTGNESVYADFKSKGYFRNEEFVTNAWHNGASTTIIGDKTKKVAGSWRGNIDFNNPEAVNYFQQKMTPFFENGLDFLKLDKTDAIPVCKAMFKLTQQLGKETGGRGFILSHSHGVENQEYKRYPGKWTDDTRSDWTVESPTHIFSPWLPMVAFKENLALYTDTSRHYYRIPFLANDMGGFAVGTDHLNDEELYIRWLEFAVFAPLTTVFSAPENSAGNIAFKISGRADSIFRKYSHLKMELFPYIYSYAHQSRLEGKNIIRPIPGHMYQYKFGEELLVAPVYVKGATTRQLFLPEGSSWINFWSGKLYKGGQTISVDSPLQQIPLFVKQGAIIPRRKYARSIESGTNDLIELNIYDGDNGTFTLIEDDGNSNQYLQGIYAKTHIRFEKGNNQSHIVIEPVRGSFKNMKPDRQWKIILYTHKKISSFHLFNKTLDFVEKSSVYQTQTFTCKKTCKQHIMIRYAN